MRIYISDNIFKSRNVLPKDSSVTLLTRLGLRTTLSPSKHNPLPFPVSSASCEPAQANKEPLKGNFTEYQL